jgi:hypothetical protein
MRLPRVLTCRLGGQPCLASTSQGVALAVVLSACSTQPQSGAVTQVPPGSSESEQCSIVGRLACTAMSSLSGDAGQNRQATCTISRAAGEVVEKCGFVETKPQTTEVERPTGSSDSVQLAWSDNSNNEKNFVIERCDQVGISVQGQKKIASCTGGWRPIATVNANITRYIDKTVSPNQTYLYRVKATNDFGTSDHSNEMSITTPSK